MSSAVFVGRAPELQRLEKRLDAALGGRGSVVLITGEAGAGKSSLVQQLLVQATLRAPETRVISATCSEQYGAGEPYQPFVEAFRTLLSQPEQPTKRRSLRELAEELAPYWVSAIPVAGNFLAASMATAGEVRRNIGGTATLAAPPSEEALFFQYTELFFEAAARHPVILFIDDLHWADRASVTLLTHLARRIAAERVLIIGTYRAADVDVGKHPILQARLELERYKAAEELVLAPLESAALSELVEAELGGPAAPEIAQWLERHAGASPLFFSELLHWLIEQELVRQRHDEWVLTSLPMEIDIPRSAESTIERRLGRLEPETYKMLEYASVEGNEFHATALALLLGADELELEEQLEPLARMHRLIRLVDTRDLPNGDISSVYEFSHSLIQDVLLKGLQGKRRILLHRKMAEILEQMWEGRTELICHKLAVHCDEGRLGARAFDYAIQAADRATRVYAHVDALELIRRALRHAGSDEQRADALERQAEANWRIGRYADAIAAFDQALLPAPSLPTERLIALRRKRLLVDRDHGERPAQEVVAGMAALEAEAREQGASLELCHILWDSIDKLGVGGASDPARAEEALRITERLGDSGLIANARYALGTLLMFHGDPGLARPHLDDAMHRYAAAEERRRVGMCHNCKAIIDVMGGDYAAAAPAFAEAAVIFDAIGDPLNEAGTRNNLGALLTRMGRFDDAEENLDEAIRIFRRLDATPRLLHPLQNMAELNYQRGNRPLAREQWLHLSEVSASIGFWNVQVIAHCGLGQIHIEDGDYDEARRVELAASELLVGHTDWSEARCAYQFFAARFAAAVGELERALELLDAVEPVMAPRDRYDWASFRLLEGEIKATLDPAAAVPILVEALAVFQQLGAEPMRLKASALLNATKGEA